MNKTVSVCLALAACVTSSPAAAFGINDLLSTAVKLGVRAVGNATSNLAASAYEAATGKKSREQVLAEKKVFLEDAYSGLEKACPQIERRQLDPAKAVITDVYEFAFADELANAHGIERRSLLTLEDVGDAVMSSPTVIMKRAELQAKAYRAGIGTIGGRTRMDRARMMEIAEAQARAYQAGTGAVGGFTKSEREHLFDIVEAIARGRSVPLGPEMPLRSVQSDPGSTALQFDLPDHFHAPILQEACVREYLGLYRQRVQARVAAREQKPEEVAREAAVNETPWPLGE